MNLREVIVDMEEKGDGLLHYGRSCVVDFFSIVLYNWALLMYKDTVKFYILVYI